MRILAFLFLVANLSGCVSASVKHKGELTCLEKNAKRVQSERIGTECQEKANEDERLYVPDIGYDGDK